MNTGIICAPCDNLKWYMLSRLFLWSYFKLGHEAKVHQIEHATNPELSRLRGDLIEAFQIFEGYI